VRLSLPPLRLEFKVTGEGMFEQSVLDNFDVEITLPADTPLLALHGTETVFKAASISGLAEFADALGFVLRNLRWDFEEDLSRHVGDIAAHRIAGLLTAFGAWQRQARQHLAENIAEYLTEENPTLANPVAVAAFSKANRSTPRRPEATGAARRKTRRLSRSQSQFDWIGIARVLESNRSVRLGMNKLMHKRIV